MKRYIILFPLVFVLCCTHTTPKYKGYSTKNGTDYYKYSDLGNSHRQPHKDDIVEVLLSYANVHDSVFWDSRDNGFPFSIFLPYDTLAAGGSYQKFLLQVNEGDSINFIVPASEVFKNILHAPLPYFLHTGDMMKVNARISAIMNPLQFAARQKAIRQYKKNMDIQEQLTLLQYVTLNHISDSAKKDGIYFIPVAEGNGPKVQKESMVSLSYKGYFLDGRIFDSISKSTPLQFRYGDTAQVIKGLEIGIKRMRQGGQAKIIIPSQLAFGENGSSTGLVPPYTSVIYEVTMLKVTDPGK